MKRYAIIFLTLLSCLSLLTAGGCGYKEGVKIEEQKAYLYFTGNTQGAEVLVDGAPFTLGENVSPDDLYQIEPGQHQIEVKQGGATVINRKLYVGEGISREIQIP